MLKKNITGVHLETKQALIYFKISQGMFISTETVKTYILF